MDFITVWLNCRQNLQNGVCVEDTIYGMGDPK